MQPDPNQKLTPSQALENLSKVSEMYQCNGEVRDALRASVLVLSDLILLSIKTDAVPPDPTR